MIESESHTPAPRTLPDPRVLFEHDVLGIALTHVADTYHGPCKVTLRSACGREYWIALPTRSQAEHAARFAIGELGGFAQSDIHPAIAADITHEDWTDWAFG